MAASTQNLSPRHKRLLAYADPLREKVFTLLTQRVASPAEITRELKLERKALPKVTNHMWQLVKLGCAEMVKEEPGTGGLPVKFFKATERALVETAEWDKLVEEDPGFAEYIVGRGIQVPLDDALAAIKGRTMGDDANFHLSRTPRNLDEQGYLELLEAAERHRREKDEIELRSAERRSESGADTFPVSDSIWMFRLPRDAQP